MAIKVEVTPWDSHPILVSDGTQGFSLRVGEAEALLAALPEAIRQARGETVKQPRRDEDNAA